MRGRAQACGVALLGTFFPFVSPATIGLVTLRKGSTEGLVILLWAALPSIVSYYFGQGSGLLTLVSVVSLLMMVVSANVLRVTSSWQATMLATMLLAIAVTLGFGLLLSAEVDLLIAKVSEIFAEIAASQGQQQAEGQEPVVPTRPLVLGLVALMLSISAIVSLLLSRWWQAMLYNPGGFGEEFHNLRLDIRVAGGSLLAFTLLLYLPGDFRFWAELMALPLLISGLSLVHYGVKALSQGRQWLVFMYVGLVVSGPVIGGLLVGLGIADSILNLRLRLTANKDRDQ
ncbi:MAG: hypothetical protein HON72_04735 [Porticoccaceae bacterium]|nr:hypothetical protein [Porticoccaceae bacterium]